MIVYYTIKPPKAWLLYGDTRYPSVPNSRYAIQATCFPGATFDLVLLEESALNVYYTLKYRGGDFYIFINKQQLNDCFDTNYVHSNKIWNELNA